MLMLRAQHASRKETIIFPQNEGALDRVIRLVLGIGVGVAVFTVLSGVLQIVAAVVAAILLVTAAVGFCPLYAVLRIRTRRKALPRPV